MTPFVVSVAYVLIWRLCVLACGLVAIILGYRLFQSGFAAHREPRGRVGQHPEARQRRAGPFFALFGAAIIAALVWTSPPEIVVPKADLQSSGQSTWARAA